MDKDFAHSYSTSTQSYLPKSYPKQPGYLEGKKDPDEEKDDDKDASASDTGSDNEMEGNMDREEGPSNHAGKSIQLIIHISLVY